MVFRIVCGRFLAFVPVLSAPQDPRASQSGSSYLQQSSDTAGGRDPLKMLDSLEQVHCVTGWGYFTPFKYILLQYLLYYI